MNNKTAMSGVVATALILVVAVVATVGFQSWFSDYQSQVLSDTEQKSSTSNQLKIQGIVGDELYLYSGSESNLSSLKIVSDSGVEMCSFSGSGEVNSSGLVGWWKLDDESSTITDYSGNGNDGKLYGNTRLLLDFNDGTADDRTAYENNGTLMNGVDCSGAGINGQGCVFDGVDDYINLNANLTDGFDEITISAWINLGSYASTSQSPILVDRQGGVNEDWQFIVMPDDNFPHKLSFGMWKEDGGSCGINSNQNISLNQWIHTLVTYDNQILRLYIDGVEDKSSLCSGKINSNSSDLRLGGDVFSGGIEFNGSIDEIAIYSKALSSEEVKNLYNSQKAKFIEFKDSKLDKAVEFDGVDDYIHLGDYNLDLNFDTNNNWSIIGLAKTSKNKFGGIFSNRYADSEIIIVSTSDSGKVGLTTRDSNGIMNRSYSPSISLNSWYEFAMVRKQNSNSSMYFNGKNIYSSFDSRTGDFISDSGNHEYFLGKTIDPIDWNLYDFFNGQIDEVRIYNRTLTEEEISKLYWNFISSNEEGINKIDLTGCNLNQGEKYNIVAFTDNQKAESYFIAK